LTNPETDPEAAVPPEWPTGSIGSLSDIHSWPSGRFRALSALVADFIADPNRFEGPLKGGARPTQSWMTSRSAVARQDALQSWTAARKALAIGAEASPAGLEAALRQLLECSLDVGTEDCHGGMFSEGPESAWT
jgi:hypothetical protein